MVYATGELNGTINGSMIDSFAPHYPDLSKMNGKLPMNGTSTQKQTKRVDTLADDLPRELLNIYFLNKI